MQKGDDGHTLNLMFGMEQNMWRQQNCKLKCHVKKLQADEMAKTFRQRVAQAEAAAKAEELRLHQEVKLILPPMFDSLCSSQFGEIFVLWLKFFC